MKKNLLALSIAAMVGGIAGGANAQVTTSTPGNPIAASGGRLAASNAPFGALTATGGATAMNGAAAATDLVVNPAGIGHALVVPYFTTQGDNASLLNIINTDAENGKAVKLRFRGAVNSDDLFDITIYLSPGDMWTANVSTDADGFSRLTTSDTSCTLPSAKEIAKPENARFKVSRLGNAGAAGTREGYIEILNMADIPARRVRGTAIESDLYIATKHVNGVAPCNAAVVDPRVQAVMDLQENALVPNDLINDPFVRGYSWPTGGLAANWTIVNVADKASFSGEAVAIQALNVTAGVGTNGAANLVWSPQTPDPVAQAIAGVLSADPLLAGTATTAAAVRASNFDFPDLSTPYTVTNLIPSAQAADLAAQISARAVINEFLTNPAVSFATDWVFSMPTRRYAVALNYAASGAARLVANTTYTAPQFVTAAINPAANNTYLSADGNRICVNTNGSRAWDREENTKTTFVISPFPSVDLCGEVSVLSFNSDTSAVLGAKLTQLSVKNDYLDGWFRIATPGIANRGLPVLGFAAAKARGSNLGGTWAHRYQ